MINEEMEWKINSLSVNSVYELFLPGSWYLGVVLWKKTKS